MTDRSSEADVLGSRSRGLRPRRLGDQGLGMPKSAAPAQGQAQQAAPAAAPPPALVAMKRRRGPLGARGLGRAV